MRRLLLGLLFGSLTACVPSVGQVQVHDGVIQIPGSELAAGRLLALGGPWEFYWGKLLQPRDFAAGRAPTMTAVVGTMRPWTSMSVPGEDIGAVGFATYRLRLRLPAQQRAMGLWFPHQFSAARVFINGEKVAEVGSIGASPQETVPDRQDTTLVFDRSGPVTEILFQIANGGFFRGGMRGTLVLGPESAVRRFATQRTIFEAVVLGFVLGAALYHLFFYFLHRGEYSFFFFSLLCFTLALRIPLQASKSYALFLGDLSWDTQARILTGLNMLTIPAGALFLRSVFPDLMSWRVVQAYAAAGVLSLFLLFGGLHTVSLGGLVYVSVLLPLIVGNALWMLLRAYRDGRTTVLMAFAFVTLGAFGGTAVYLNWIGSEGGQFAIIGYLFFVLLQALALSRFFLGAVKARASLSDKLHESQAALSRQREELQISLHDSLGGALTDLQIHTERKMQTAEGHLPVLSGIHERIADTIRMFRGQLLFMEDLEMTAQDLLPGIQLALLRRYADAGREFDFDVSPEAVRAIENRGEFALPVRLTLDLFFLVVELCTNDLKYGQGESFWRFGVAGNMLHLVQRNGIRLPDSGRSHHPLRASDRVRKLGGTLSADLMSGEFSVEVRIPLGR